MVTVERSIIKTILLDLEKDSYSRCQLPIPARFIEIWHGIHRDVRKNSDTFDDFAVRS
jgi:hypothetical protein